MENIEVRLTLDKNFDREEVLSLYRKNNWSAAEKPDRLILGLKNSDCLVLAYQNGKLVGLGNAISDGYLVVYYPHLLVNPDFHGKGIGKLIVQKMQEKYKDFHQQMLTADGGSIAFYKKCGFERAGKTESMWIYTGNEH